MFNLFLRRVVYPGRVSSSVSNHGSEVASGTPDILFYCGDINETVRTLRERGVELTQKVEDHGYGLDSRRLHALGTCSTPERRARNVLTPRCLEGNQ
jgi:hypothetical protein